MPNVYEPEQPETWTVIDWTPSHLLLRGRVAQWDLIPGSYGDSPISIPGYRAGHCTTVWSYECLVDFPSSQARADGPLTWTSPEHVMLCAPLEHMTNDLPNYSEPKSTYQGRKGKSAQHTSQSAFGLQNIPGTDRWAAVAWHVFLKNLWGAGWAACILSATWLGWLVEGGT